MLEGLSTPLSATSVEDRFLVLPFNILAQSKR